MNVIWIQIFRNNTPAEIRSFYGECLSFLIKPGSLLGDGDLVEDPTPEETEIINGIKIAKDRINDLIADIRAYDEIKKESRVREQAYAKLSGIPTAGISAWLVAYYRPTVKHGENMKPNQVDRAFDKIFVIHGRKAIRVAERREWLRTFVRGYCDEWKEKAGGPGSFNHPAGSNEIAALEGFAEKLAKSGHI